MNPLRINMLRIIALCLMIPNVLHPKLTTLKYFDPAPNYSANDSMVPPNSQFLNLKKANTEVINIEQYNHDIDAAMARIDKGEFTSHEDFFKELEFDSELENLSGTILFPEKLKTANEFLSK